MILNNRKIIHKLYRTKSHDGEYFQIIYFKNRYILYYCIKDSMKAIWSSNLDFNKAPRTIIQYAPRSVFCIINENHHLLMLCGCHTTLEERGEIPYKDRIKTKKTLLNPYETRQDKKNGMYLISSTDGFNWKLVYDRPVLHSFICSDTVKMGQIGFDTSPYLIKFNSWYFYYGRLNLDREERHIYMRKSKDLINWSFPLKINIENEYQNDNKKNYYNFVILKKENILYGFVPYFEINMKDCQNLKVYRNKCLNGQTLIMKSIDGINWNIIDYCMKHNKKYKHRINDVRFINKKILLFYRDNVLDRSASFSMYELDKIE